MSRTACLLFRLCPQLRTPLLLLRRAVAGVLRFSAEKAIPGGPFLFFFLFFSSPQWRWSSRRQPSPLFTSRPRSLRQWRDSAAGPISSGRLPQDKCESSTSLFYQLIGLFLTCAYLARGSSQFLSLSIGARYYLSAYSTGFQASRFMAKKQIVQAAMTQNNDLAMFKEGWTISSCPKRLEINRANLKVLAVLLNYHSLFETDNKTAWI